MKLLNEERAAFLAKDFQRGFIDHCGFRAVRVEHGRFESEVVVEERHRQQDGFIHAGVMATMADHTAGYAAFTIVDPEFQILTIEFKINFLRPAFGSTLRCRARTIRGGSRVIVAESEVFDIRDPAHEPHTAAKAMVTLMAVRREKLSPPTRRAARGVLRKRPGLGRGPGG
jgi:uncharacterized protein (TIGR00369 family)